MLFCRRTLLLRKGKTSVDNTEKLPTGLSFCTGYGGLDSGIEAVVGPVRNLAYVEIEAYAIANLVDKMETGKLVPAPVWTNVKTFPSYLFRGTVDILNAGYPCQPFSAAGQRKGEEDPRHLWPHIGRAIAVIRPTICFFENVEGHITLGLRTVLADLFGLGYRVATERGEPTWGIFSAAEVGAPHQRKRTFILAVRDDKLANARYLSRCTEQGFEQKKHPKIIRRGDSLAYANSKRSQRFQQCGGG